jgi:hypothetical protein
VIETKKPRRVELNNNIVRYNAANIEPVHYPECFEGIIASYEDRYPCNMELMSKIYGEWAKTAEYMRV